MVINRKIGRTILESKSQYLGSVMLIVISCLLFTMMNLLAANMNEMTASFEKDFVQEDASFITGERLHDIPGLEARFNARIEESASFDYKLSEGKKLRIFRQNEKVNIPAIVEGEALSGNDILLDPAFAKANKLAIGGTLKIFGRNFRIAGYTSLPNYIYQLEAENDLMSDPQSFGIGVVSKEDFNGFDQDGSFYSIKFNTAPAEKESAAAKFRDYLKSENILISKWTDVGENPRVTFVTAKIQGIGKVSSSMPVAILLLTCILTGIVIRRLLRREAVIIGTFYAQGYRRREIVSHYLLYPFIIALAGGFTGTVLGAVLLKPMLGFMISYFNIPMTGITYIPAYLAVSLLLPVVFLVASGWFVLGRVLRNSPVELMRGARESARVNFLEKHLKLEKLKFAMKFKLREQLRSLSRLAFLLLGVIMATMLLLLGFTAKSSMDFLMKDSLKNTYKFQHEYVFNSLQTGQAPNGAEMFSASVFQLKTDNKSRFEICGIEPDSKYISLKDKSGKELSKDNVIITRPLAEKLKVGPGDTVRAVNRLDSREYSVTVDCVADTYIGEYIFMPVSRLNAMLGLPSLGYMGLWSDAALDIPENKLLSSRTIDDSIRAFMATTEPLQAAIGIISFLSFIIGLIVIYVVTSLIIEENRNNISLMKVFGYRKKEINSLILNSSSVIIILGYIIGIPLIMASMSGLYRSLTENLNLTVPVSVNYAYILAGFVVIYLTYEVSKALSRKKINRISMREALISGTE